LKIDPAFQAEERVGGVDRAAFWAGEGELHAAFIAMQGLFGVGCAALRANKRVSGTLFSLEEIDHPAVRAGVFTAAPGYAQRSAASITFMGDDFCHFSPFEEMRNIEREKSISPTAVVEQEQNWLLWLSLNIEEFILPLGNQRVTNCL